MKICQAFTVIIATLSVAGCGKRQPQQKHAPTRQELELKRRKEIPGEISGDGWHIKWVGRVPNTGKMATNMEAFAERGSLSNPNDPQLWLEHVRASLYREGKRSATLTSDMATAYQNRKSIQAEGHVVITSVTDPPDTVIKADNVSWDSTGNLVVATGNVHAVSMQEGRKTRSMQGERIVFDTRLREIRNE